MEVCRRFGSGGAVARRWWREGACDAGVRAHEPSACGDSRRTRCSLLAGRPDNINV
ncbi:hypothetical protein BN2537_3919 [Streptomyces venezuelae]|nr:hypothetical protein BN2537_3919 [Streptomyces venezuelae]